MIVKHPNNPTHLFGQVTEPVASVSRDFNVAVGVSGNHHTHTTNTMSNNDGADGRSQGQGQGQGQGPRGGPPRGMTPQQMVGMPGGFVPQGYMPYPQQYVPMGNAYGRAMPAGQIPQYMSRGYPQQMYGGPGATGNYPRMPQGQVWTPPTNAQQPSTATAAASPKTVPTRKRAGLKIINPDTKEEVKADPKAEPPKKETEPAKEAAPSESANTPQKATTDASLADMTPNTRRRHKLQITNPTDGSVIQKEPSAKDTTSDPASDSKNDAAPKSSDQDAKAKEEAAPAKGGFAAAAAKPASIPPPARVDPPRESAKPGFAAAAAKPPSAQPSAAATAPPAQPTKGDAAGTPPAAPAALEYADGQWSPSNPSGAKVYGKDFLLQVRQSCSRPPACLNTSIIPPPQRQQSGGDGRRPRGSEGFQTGFGGMGSGGGQGARRGPGPARQSSGGPRMGGPAMGRGSGGRRSIALPAREAPKLNKAENRYVPSVQKGAAAEKSMLDEARMALNKLTLEKFDKLSVRLLELGLSDVDQLPAFTSMIFQKAVDEPFFCVVYSKLCKALHDMALERSAVITKPGTDELTPIASHFKSLLLNNCQQQFEKAEKDALREREAEVAAREKAEDPAELEKISKMPRAEREKYELNLREEKRDAVIRVAKVRRHIIGNITFIGELFLVDMVTEPIMRFCIEKLLTSAQSDEETKEHREESLEQLCKLLETAGAKLERKYRKKAKGKGVDLSGKWEDYFKQMATIASSGTVSSRIKFAIQDVIDMRKAGWEARNTKKGPKTIDEIHQEAKHELHMAAIATEQHQRSGGGMGRGSRGRMPPMQQQPRSRDNWVEVQRKNAKVDGNMFGSLGGKPTQIRLGVKPKLGKPGATKGGAAPNGNVQGGRYVKGGNQFSLLSESKSPKAPAESEEASVTAPDASPAAEAEPNFPPEILQNKMNGTINEYFSIKMIDEVKQSLDDWGRVSAVYVPFCATSLNMLEMLKADNRASLIELFKQLIGADRGVPADAFLTALDSFFEELPDIVCDAPKLPDYVGELIAAAILGSSSALGAMNLLATEAVQQLLYGDLALKIALAAYSAIKASDGEAKAVALYAESGVSLNDILPNDEERVKDLADRAGVAFLLTASPATSTESEDVGATVEKMVLEGASYDSVRAYVEKVVTAEERADGRAGSKLARSIVSAVTSKTTLAAGSSAKPTAEDEAKEAELLDNYTDVLRFVADSPEGQLATVIAVAQFAAEKSFPKGMVNRLFDYFYEKDVVDEEVYLKFKTDADLEKTMPKKTIAVQQAENFYDRLAQPE